jgi:hypothetical protein
VKRDLAVLVALLAGSVLWIEHGRRFDIEAPTDAQLVMSAGAVCPESENVPYSTECITFMQGGAAPRLPWRTTAAKHVVAPEEPELQGPACPANNENVPYSARCIRFLSGWWWKPN